MGVFGRIIGCFVSCFGSNQRKNRSSNSSYYGSRVSRRSWTTPERPSSSGLYRGSRTTTQPKQAREARKNDFNYDRESLFRDTSNSYKCTSNRSGSAAAAHINRQSSSTNTARSEVSQYAFPHHCHQVKPPQTHHVKPPRRQAQPVTPQAPVKYYMKNVTRRLQATSKDKAFIPKSNVIYHNQWTVCSSVVINQFGNQLSNSLHTVKLSSNSRVEFCDSKTKDGRLQFNMKSSETGNISISIKIDNSTFIKEFYVTCSPCSSTLSEMVVKKIDSLNSQMDKCLYRIAIVDVFGEPILSDSPAICNLEISSPCEYYVEGKLMYSEDGKKYFDIAVVGERPWKTGLVLLNGTAISPGPVTKFEVFNEERGEIEYLLEENENALLGEDQVSIHDFVDRDGSRMFIPLLTGNCDGEFVPYNENNCQIERLPGRNGYHLVCQHAKKYDILGVDFAHINNIKRVLQLKHRIEVHEIQGKAAVVIGLNNVQSHLHPICKEVVQHLLRGLYYRRKASEAARIRMEWKTRFISLDEVLSLSLEGSPSLKLCKFLKDYFGKLMNRYNFSASNELFEFFNFQRDESEVDLHGLLVADEKRLESQRLDMLRGSLSDEQIDALFGQCKMKSFKGRKKQALKKELLKGEMCDDEIQDFIQCCRGYIHDESRLKAFEQDLLQRRARSKHYVDAIINEWRSESDEAIRLLKITLDRSDLEEAIKNNSPWLEIIVGAGHHSRNNEQNIRPKVEKLLKERKLQFAAVNKGSLVVTFKSYSGPEPCFGEYYCENCDRCWKSSKSYVRKYQKCAHCNVKCWPVKQREKERVVNYHRDGAGSVRRRSKPHQSSLCQKCQELGYPCNDRGRLL